ncbi:MAG TPA: hypothetical protein VGJ20_21815 [Xanthobacteraceae bacterium]|jgi:outer membrane murein-binding lipoprotein Lpp
MALASSPRPNVEHDQVDDVLRSFKQWLDEQARVGRVALHPEPHKATQRDDDAAHNKFYFSPSIAAPESSLDLDPPHAGVHGGRVNEPSVARRVARSFIVGLLITAIVGAALAWHSAADDKTKTMIRAWDLALSNWLASVLNSKLSAGANVAAESVSQSSDRAPPPASNAPPAASAPPAAAAPVSTGSSPQLQHQLATMASDLAAVRRRVEQLAARQDHMAADIATLQADAKSANQRPKRRFSRVSAGLPVPVGAPGGRTSVPLN